MDASTIIFIATLFIAFVFLRWLIAPIPQTTPAEFSQLNTNTSRNTSTVPAESAEEPRRHRREVADSMIEVVQAIAPQLTRSQIRMDLERSGSVEVTVQRYMDEGTLPFPPNEPEQEERTTESNGVKSAPASKSQINLIERYDLQDKIDESPAAQEGGSSSNLDDRSGLLNKRREDMILNARKRLASKLKNELEL